jgi:SAM-dependent methyltransferase
LPRDELTKRLGAVADDPKPEYCCFDRWAVDTAARARRRGIGAPLTGRMLQALEQVGVGGRTVLDVGCGVGDLALGTLARGATIAEGIDMSEGAIEQARRLATERGLSERTTFTVGDGSTEPLARHDVVALNRVVCCYPSVEALLANSLGAAGEVYAYTAPVHAGPVGLFNRFWVGIANISFQLRRKRFRGFRAYVHDLDAVDRTIADAGFRSVHRSRERFIWRLAVFTRS